MVVFDDIKLPDGWAFEVHPQPSHTDCNGRRAPQSMVVAMRTRDRKNFIAWCNITDASEREGARLIAKDAFKFEAAELADQPGGLPLA